MTLPQHNTISAARHQTLQLKGTWYGRHGMACCPAHADRTPSLSITPGHTAVLYHCFAGCCSSAILEALKRLDLAEPPVRQSFGEAPARARDLSELAREIWTSALPLAGTPGERYLEYRAIERHTLGRYDPASKTKAESGKLITLPALVLPITDGSEILAIQRIFLDRATGRKSAALPKAKRTLGFPGGGAVRLGVEPGEILNLAEGFEDAASAMDLENLDHCWAVCGAERYAQIAIPPQVSLVRIYSQPGPAARAAITRAESALTHGGRALEVIPPPPGGDWNDAARSRASPERVTASSPERI